MSFTNGGKKPKSPSAPSRSLEDAYDDVLRLYEHYSHGVFTKPEVASTLKQSANSGAFFGRFYTLQQYGLIEPVEAGLKVSSLFMTMKSSPRNSADFKRCAMTALRRPQIFGELLNEFREKLPPSTTIIQRLEMQKKFNAQKAKDTASVFERSLRFANVLDMNNNILPIRDDGQNPAQKVTPENNEAQTENAPTGVENIDESSAKGMRTEVPLPNSRKVVLLYPHDLSESEANKVAKVLAALAE